MKKWIAVIVAAALMLLSAGAMAQDAPEVIEVPEKLYYNAELGYTITYSEDEFLLGDLYGLDTFTIVGDETAVALMNSVQIFEDSADAFLAEAVGGFDPAAVVSEVTKKLSENTMVCSVQAKADGIVNRFYLVYEPAGEEAMTDMACVTAVFPEPQEAEYGAKFDALMNAVVFDASQTLYKSEEWQMLYPATLVQPQKIYSRDGFTALSGDDGEVSMMIVPGDIAPEQISALLDEAVGGYEGDYVISGQTERMLENGLAIRWIEVEQEGQIDRYYAVWLTDAAQVYCVTATYPAADAGLYGNVFDAMLDSFELMENEN